MAQWPSDTYVLIPSFKSAGLLQEFLPVLMKEVPREKICIVDDASDDGTDRICESFHIDYLSHDVNLGKGAALSTGFSYLMGKGARWIVTMDADGQHSPDDLSKFLEAAKSTDNLAMCIGSRNMKPGVMPLVRICSNLITSRILSILSGAKVIDSQCGYRIYASAFLEKITITHGRFEMESEVILKAVHLGFTISFTNVQTLYLNEQSHISHIKDTFRWVRAVIKIWFELRKNPLIR